MTDLDIIKRIRAGNTKAYWELVERYENKIYGVLHQATGDHALALTEEVFVRAYMQIGNVSDDMGYLRRLFSVLLEVLGEAEVDTSFADKLTFYQAINTQPQNDAVLLILRHVFDYTYEQIALTLTMDEKVVFECLVEAQEKARVQAGLGAVCCKEYRKALQLYMDQELMRIERMEIEAHLEECEACIKAYEQLLRLYDKGEYIEIPHSVSEKVIERVLEEAEDDSTAFAVKEQVSFWERVEKDKNLKTWVVVASLLVLTLVSWFFTMLSEGRLLNDSSIPQNGSEIVGTGEEYSAQLAQIVNRANAMILEFRGNRSGINEKAFIMTFANYLSKQFAAECPAMPDTPILGTITLSPDSGFLFTVTQDYRLFVDDGTRIMQLHTTQDALIGMLDILGQ